MIYELKNYKDKIKELYLDGLNSREIGELLGFKASSIAYHVKQMGIARDRGVISPVGKEDYFDIIDTEKKAYYLGWLMADGNVSIHKGQYSIKLHINEKDVELIHGILKEVDCNNKVVFKPNNAVYASFSSKHMVKSLIRHGIIPAKSGKEYMPNIKDDLKPHFIRGFFDGDGITCIKCHSKTNRGGYASGFVSSLEMCKQIQDEINSNQKIHPASGSYYFTGGIKFSRKLYHYMYNEATIWLKRKRKRMDIICLFCSNTEVTSEIKESLVL